jgi:hypothetical protein
MSPGAFRVFELPLLRNALKRDKNKSIKKKKSKQLLFFKGCGKCTSLSSFFVSRPPLPDASKKQDT